MKNLNEFFEFAESIKGKRLYRCDNFYIDHDKAPIIKDVEYTEFSSTGGNVVKIILDTGIAIFRDVSSFESETTPHIFNGNACVDLIFNIDKYSLSNNKFYVLWIA